MNSTNHTLSELLLKRLYMEECKKNISAVKSQPIIMQSEEFWLFVAWSLSLFMFLVIWAIVIVACKLIIKIFEDQNPFEDSEMGSTISGPSERNPGRLSFSEEVKKITKRMSLPPKYEEMIETGNSEENSPTFNKLM